MAAGEAKSDFWWLVGVVCLLGLAWLVTGGPGRQESRVAPLLEPPAPLGRERTPVSSSPKNSKSPAGDDKNAFPIVKISKGNAQNENSARAEYITLVADRDNRLPVNITGWRLANSGRLWLKGATIPSGTTLFIAGAPHPAQEPIILWPGDSVVITTGSFPATTPINIDTSFKTNICSGYIENLPDYRFTPSLRSNCPAPRDEVATVNLDSDCYNIVKRLGSCHTPQRTTARDRDQTELIDGAVIPASCRDFILREFNYNACVARHRGDADFFGQEWRVFLRQSDELWYKDRETITLYDNLGNIVDQVKY